MRGFAFVDKLGAEVIIRRADMHDYRSLLGMYDLFEPKKCAQGIPPADPQRRKELVRKVLEQQVNVVCEHGEKIIGHACLLDIQPMIRAELEIAVHQDWRDRGLGTAMLGRVVEIARSCHYRSIWLTVTSLNRRAIHIYEKYGFVFCCPLDAEREMELILNDS
ncbi:MAG: GNAT family N-acetyltransferase [Deltaproteobacteria bacterium]|nr:GNAT family N-acetyltransferase [Deltaproteobacteria bacterium]